MKGKPVSASALIDQVREHLPHDLPLQGALFRGKLMHLVDHLAAMVAKRHAGVSCVTLGIDSVRFLNPAHQEDILVCKASVNKAWQTSMEVGVKIVAEDFRTLEQKEILSAYVTFVAVDEDLKPVEVVPVIPETPEQLQRYEEAEKRRQYRLKHTYV